MKTRGPRAALVVACIIAFVLGIAAGALADAYPFPAKPIPNQKDAEPVELFVGAAAVAHSVTAAAIPQNPFPLPGPWSRVARHGDRSRRPRGRDDLRHGGEYRAGGDKDLAMPGETIANGHAVSERSGG